MSITQNNHKKSQGHNSEEKKTGRIAQSVTCLAADEFDPGPVLYFHGDFS